VAEAGCAWIERKNARLLVLEVLLLRPDDTAWTHDTQPGYALIRRKAQVLHHVDAYQGAGATQAREAVHGKCPLRHLRDTQEVIHYLVRGG